MWHSMHIIITSLLLITPLCSHANTSYTDETIGQIATQLGLNSQSVINCMRMANSKHTESSHDAELKACISTLQQFSHDLEQAVQEAKKDIQSKRQAIKKDTQRAQQALQDVSKSLQDINHTLLKETATIDAEKAQAIAERANTHIHALTWLDTNNIKSLANQQQGTQATTQLLKEVQAAHHKLLIIMQQN